MSATAPTLAERLSPRERTLILLALSLGGFAIGTSEFAAMGLMLEISRGLGIGETQVGHLISAYAIGVVVGAPVLAFAGAGYARRTLLLGLMGFYAVGNLASALAPNYTTMLLARFVAGLPHGAYFGVAMLVAAAISPPGQRGKAAVGAAHLRRRPEDELVDVAVVVGEQDVALNILDRGAGIVSQAGEREVGAQAVEERQASRSPSARDPGAVPVAHGPAIAERDRSAVSR